MDSTPPKNAKPLSVSGKVTNASQKRKADDVATEFEYDGKNRCLICKVDMGDCNPRQYCRKTYCENGPMESGE
jgi:hypothetical protein